MFMDAGVPHLSPPDTDVEDHEDNGLGDEYEDMVQEEDEDEEDDWREDRVIEVRWRDGLTGLSHVQVTTCPLIFSCQCHSGSVLFILLACVVFKV